MSETEDNEGSTASKTMTLSLKRTVDAGHVRQKFSHGRSKTVVVEKRKKRTITALTGKSSAVADEAASPPTPATPAPTLQKKPRRSLERSAPAGDRSGNLVHKLSTEEKDARLKALTAARARESEEKIRLEEEAKRQAEIDAKRVAEEAEAKRLAEIEARRREDEGEPAVETKPVVEAKKEQPAEVPVTDVAAAEAVALKAENAPKRAQPPSKPDQRGGLKKPQQERQPAKRAGDRRPRGRLTITNALDEGQRERSLASLRRKRERQKSRLAGGPQAPRDKISREVVIPEVITIQELANRMTERSVDVIKFLMKEGEMYKPGDVIDTDTAELIAEEFGHTVKRGSEADVEFGL
jgi:translation initiation factor IF-2